MRVFVCSPYRGDVAANVKRAEELCALVAKSGNVPFAPHLLFTRFLDDSDPVQRAQGIAMGLAELTKCNEILIASGPPSEGMAIEIAFAMSLGIQTATEELYRKWLS